jgi:hypothetical protein
MCGVAGQCSWSIRCLNLREAAGPRPALFIPYDRMHFYGIRKCRDWRVVFDALERRPELRTNHTFNEMETKGQ